ncbi:MAG: extracellular solute-binding protein [Propionibacteriaceae bacterium]|jgi:multiple sugar transport system substrate-binding protein|nr:extracellular solute-binding protein [Propionibacteriaceae bacterium]
MLAKRLAPVLGLALAATLLAGCGDDSDNTDPAASDGSPGGVDTSQQITLDLAFWGNDVRAEMYEQAVALFNQQYPNIKVNQTFLAFPEFWEKRQIEAAGGGLPDVMMFDYSYLRQYSENSLLLDLAPYLGNTIKTDGFTEAALGIGVVDGHTTAISIGTNAWAMYLNNDVLSATGVSPYAGGTAFADYDAWMDQVTQAGGGTVYGGQDWSGRIQNFEIWMRAQGKDLFTDESEVNFTADELKAFWQAGQPCRDGVCVPQSKLEEVYPKSGFGSAQTASELTWDNFGASYMGDLGVEQTSLTIAAPPTYRAGAKDLYLKPSMMHAIAATTDQPEAAATLVDFLLNSEAVGAVFGTNRGIPASATQLAGVDLDPLSQKIYDYEQSITDRLGDAPPVPVVGYGTIEEKFRVLGTELGLGTVTVDQAVEQFMSEVDNVLNA